MWKSRSITNINRFPRPKLGYPSKYLWSVWSYLCLNIYYKRSFAIYIYFFHRSWIGRLCIGCREEGSRKLRLSPGFPADSLPGWWHWVRYGNTPHLQNTRGVPRQNHEHLLRGAVSQGVRHRGGALQRHSVRPPAGREHRWDILHRQRGSLRHLLQDSKAGHSNIRRSQPSGISHNVRSVRTI